MPYLDIPAQPMMTDAERKAMLKAWGAPEQFNEVTHTSGDRTVILFRSNYAAPWPVNATLGSPSACRTHMDTVTGFDY